jgi:glycosyltransferase involved in cell wall biosynthesis
MSEKRPKKVLYLITKSEPFGGAGKYVYDLATNLPPEYEPVAGFGGEGLLKTKLAERGIRILSIPHLARDISLGAEFSVFFDLLKILKKEHPDIVHLNSSKIGGLGTLAVRTHNIFISLHNFFKKHFSAHYSLLTTSSIVFTAHGWPFKEERPWWQKKTMQLLSWVSVVLSHTTIVVSADDQQHTNWMPFIESKIHMIHNGITPPQFVTHKEARVALSKGSITLAKEDICVCMIGELTPNKGYQDALCAFEILTKTHTNARLIIIGAGEEQKELQDLIVMKELTQHVVLLGSLPNAARYLTGVDIFLLTSHKEGLPYVVIEAGFASLPVVATAVSGVPEIIDDMRSGILIRPHSADEIAKALSFLIEQKEYQRAFGDALYQKVRGEFSFKKMLEKTVRLYAQRYSKK